MVCFLPLEIFRKMTKIRLTTMPIITEIIKIFSNKLFIIVFTEVALSEKNTVIFSSYSNPM
jgi:hypothetical protein